MFDVHMSALPPVSPIAYSGRERESSRYGERRVWRKGGRSVANGQMHSSEVYVFI